MNKQLVTKILCLLLVICVLLYEVEAKKNKHRKKTRKSMVLRQKETNPVDFIRLTVMRLIYGMATRVGLGEQISEAWNGAFVPPGADEYDDYGGDFNLFDRNDDYDY